MHSAWHTLPLDHSVCCCSPLGAPPPLPDGPPPRHLLHSLLIVARNSCPARGCGWERGAQQSTPAAGHLPSPTRRLPAPLLLTLALSAWRCHLRAGCRATGPLGTFAARWAGGAARVGCAVCCESVRRLTRPACCRLPRPEYKLLSKKGEGTFSEVLKATCIKNGKPVAIKCMKNHFDSLDQARVCRPGACLVGVSSPHRPAGEQPA